MSDGRSGYQDIFLPLVGVAVIFVIGMAMGMFLCWLLA